MRVSSEDAELFAFSLLTDRHCTNMEILLGSCHMHPGYTNMTVPKGETIYECVLTISYKVQILYMAQLHMQYILTNCNQGLTSAGQTDFNLCGSSYWH